MHEAFVHIGADHTPTQMAIVGNCTTYGGSYVSARCSYAGVSAYPTKKVDHDHSSVGGGGTWNTHYTWIDTYLHQDITTTPASIALSYTRTGYQVTMTAVLTLDATLSGTHRMWMAFLEDVPTQPATNPHWYARAGKPGTDSSMLVTISSAGQTQTFTYTFKLNSGWIWTGSNHYGVAFLQADTGTKEVKQAKRIDMNTINDVYVENTSLGAVKSMFR